jgi:cytoskeleton protein RodZ
MNSTEETVPLGNIVPMLPNSNEKVASSLSGEETVRSNEEVVLPSSNEEVASPSDEETALSNEEAVSPSSNEKAGVPSGEEAAPSNEEVVSPSSSEEAVPSGEDVMPSKKTALPKKNMPLSEGVPSSGHQLRDTRLARGLRLEEIARTLKFNSRQIEAIVADRMDTAVSSAEEIAPSSEIIPSLGQQLRDARLARGLSIEDIVRTLKFNRLQIEAIEAGHLDIVSGSVFLRGLVRNYARLLKLDAEPLLKILDKQVPVQKLEICMPKNMGIALPKSDTHQVLPFIVASVLLLLVAGAMTTWHYLDSGANRGEVTRNRTHAVPTNPVVPQQVVQHEGTDPDVPSVEIGQQVTAAMQSSTATTPQPTTAVTQPVTVVQPTAAATPVVPPAGGRQLLFEFQGESWLEVKDVSGAVVLSGVYRSGTQSVTGQAPFEIVIGNAGVVVLRDDDKPVDLKPYTRLEVARLILK